MQSKLYIERHVVGKMIAKAEDHSEEICGFLLGNDVDRREITGIMPTRNASSKDKRKTFAIDPLEYLHAEDYAADNNLELLGIFHSHPNHPATPSETDRVAAQPFFSYVIVSVMQHKFADVRSWRLNNEQQFEEERIIQY
jgi:proteasome lid subunit RPN8/RPN11